MKNIFPGADHSLSSLAPCLVPVPITICYMYSMYSHRFQSKSSIQFLLKPIERQYAREVGETDMTEKMIGMKEFVQVCICYIFTNL